jgi:hypothetical protein
MSPDIINKSLSLIYEEVSSEVNSDDDDLINRSNS